MRHGLALGLVALMMTPACAQPALPRDVPAESRADIYIAVLRRYLSTPSENSLPAGTFRRAFVLDRANPSAAEPIASHRGDGEQIPRSDQQRMASALADLMPIDFVATREEVLIPAKESPNCMVVREQGILITLAPPKGEGDGATVGINGYFACLAATWLTYVVKRDASGWTVTGTTGSMAVA
jgi:hypothetical protein